MLDCGTFKDRALATSVEEPVVIVGGGIAGLALARVLRGGSVPHLLLERRREAIDGGLAINLPGNAIGALAKLGLRDQIEQIGYPLRRREYRTASDKLLFAIDETGFWGKELQPRSVLRSTLLSLLAQGMPDGAARYDAEVDTLDLQHGRPTVRLKDGTAITGSLVVGADGVNSAVRRAAFRSGGGPGHALLADMSWRFMAPNPGLDCWTVWASAGGMVLLMPVSETEVYGWAAITAPKMARGSGQALVEMAAEFPPVVQDAVRYAASRPAGLYHSPLEEVRLEHWHADHVGLIGDAAHATAPVWAQGAALGLEDALCLGGLITTRGAVPAALAEFEAVRRPRVAHVQRMTDAMSKAAKLPPLVRRLLLPFVGPKKYQQTYGPLKDGF